MAPDGAAAAIEADALARAAVLAGTHALALFGALLVLLLASAASLWWARQRHAAWRARRSPAPLPLLGLRLAASAVVVGVGIAVFAQIAGQIGAGRPLAQADQALTDALSRSVPPPVLRAFAAITHLGDTLTLTALCIAVAIALGAARHVGLALGYVAAVAGNALLNVTLKDAFFRVRPLHDGGLAFESSYSFPSGHSSGSLVAYGMLAYVALRLLPARWHLPVALAALTLAFTVGASRIFLGVHFASDVLAGFASGAAWLAVCVGAVEVARWWVGRPGRAPAPRWPAKG